MRLMQEHDVHIIMTDQRMPHITGVELLSKLRTKYPQAVRLLFTGYADVEAIIAAINQGHIFRFLRKPWQPDELIAAVREAASEYDRLVQQAEEIGHLREEVRRLHERISVLEQEVRRLHAVAPRPSGTS
jgi:response regulator RpfG family c-di-GMP phosphodiesterase